MTLIVSDISNLGIVMVGDSAITVREKDGTTRIVSGAVKVQFSRETNIGFAMWGQADVGGKIMDKWMADFIMMLTGRESLEDVGEKLSEELNSKLEGTGKSWDELRRGIHIAGYDNRGLPNLYHVHCGPDDEIAHELRLYKDYPTGQGWNDEKFRKMLKSHFIHLRNGFYPHFQMLFEGMLEYRKKLAIDLGVIFPKDELENRYEFYKMLVRFVAGTLSASGERPSVNDSLNAIAFDRTGVKCQESIDPRTSCTGSYRHHDILF